MVRIDRHPGVRVDYDSEVDVLYVKRRWSRIDVHHHVGRVSDLAIALDAAKNIVGLVLLDASTYSHRQVKSQLEGRFKHGGYELPSDIGSAVKDWFETQRSVRSARWNVNGTVNGNA